ncbi:MAG: polyprenyl synthetase family protein [Pirellulales bacterium]|nr:polyprenyl synthetase family protein [Pirellulales bacterium]
MHTILSSKNISSDPVLPPTSVAATGGKSATINSVASAGMNGHAFSGYAPREEKLSAQRQEGWQIPPTPQQRQELRGVVRNAVPHWNIERLTAAELADFARKILHERQLNSEYHAWVMVIAAGEYWSEKIRQIPPERILLLLPPVTGGGSSGRLNASWQQVALQKSQQRGFQVLCTTETDAILHALLSGRVQGVLGVDTLQNLEKAWQKLLPLGLPCVAIPLLDADAPRFSPEKTSSNSPHPAVDEAWVWELLDLAGLPNSIEADDSRAPHTHRFSQKHPEGSVSGVDAGSRRDEIAAVYLPIWQGAAGMFTPEMLEQLVPRFRGGPSLAAMNGKGISGLSPICGTEALAYDFLTRGGKHSRPFITLGVYFALTAGDFPTPRTARDWLATLPASIKRVAMSIETFHKASLVHDDIEDDDPFRYGSPTLHRSYGISTAINVGDYLIGLGYRLVSREAAALGPAVVSDILDCLADAHLKLTEGQGAELLWRDSHEKHLSPAETLQIYALKTSPAFEAALFAGLRLAGPLTPYRTVIYDFARQLGIAFQILNDLGDWQGDDHNKLQAAGDILGGRPTILWALALQNLPPTDRQRLRQLAAGELSPTALAEIRQLYQSAGVLETARLLVDEHRVQALQAISQVQPPALRALLHHLLELVLGCQAPSAS